MLLEEHTYDFVKNYNDNNIIYEPVRTSWTLLFIQSLLFIFNRTVYQVPDVSTPTATIPPPFTSKTQSLPFSRRPKVG